MSSITHKSPSSLLDVNGGDEFNKGTRLKRND